MTSSRRVLPLLVALLILGNFNSIHVSSESPSSLQTTSEPPTIPPLKNTETSVSSSDTENAPGARKKAIPSGTRDKTRPRDPPGSPVKLFMPDEFQFYTLNGYGQLVMKQMTKKEIQGMIAANVGGGNPTSDEADSGQHYQAQLIGGVPKVSDVVQNVQKVLKSELNKPVPVYPLSSSIPGNVNSQWTNMLPYILSGGSVDQQDQDASIILPTLDADHPYFDVAPLKDSKPSSDQFEPGSNYVQIQPTFNEQEVKLTSRKPALNNSEKPIYLLGNMALDSDILGEHEKYTSPTKETPLNRPVLTSIYQKFTTSKPFEQKDTHINLQNVTNNKPTLYVPVSASPALQGNTQNKKNHSQSNIYKTKPNEKINLSAVFNNEPIESIANYETTKITAAPGYSHESEFTRIPMIQVPVISAEKVMSSTQRINQQKTPIFQILPTITPGSSSSTTNSGLLTTKLNERPTNNIKKPEINNKPSISYYNPHEFVTKANTVNFTTTLSYYPVHTSAKISYINTTSTHRPLYQLVTKINTVKHVKPTNRPTYEFTTNPSVTKPTFSSTEQLTNEVDAKESTTTMKSVYPHHSIYETSKFTNSLKITQIPHSTYQLYSIEKNSLPPFEIATKQAITHVELNKTKSPSDTQETRIIPMNVIQQISEHKKYNISLASRNSTNVSDTLKTTESGKINYNNKAATSAPSHTMDNYSHSTVLYEDSTPKLKKNLTDSSINKVIYATNKISNDNKHIISSITSETSKLPVINGNFVTNKPSNHSEIHNIILSSQKTTVKMEENNNYEETITKSNINILSQDSNTGNSNNFYYTTILQDTTKEPEIIYKQTDKTPIYVTETIAPIVDSYLVKGANINASKNQNESYTLPNELEINNIAIQYNEYDKNNVTNDLEKISLPINSEITTPFNPMYDGSTEYDDKYNFDEMKKPFANEEDSVKPLKDNNTDLIKVDYTGEYNSLLNKIVNFSNANYYIENLTSENETKKTASTSVNNSILTYKYSTKDLYDGITTPLYTSNYEINTVAFDKLTTNHVNENTDFDLHTYPTKASYKSKNSVTEDKLAEILSGKENEMKLSNLNTILKPSDTSNKKSTIQHSTISSVISTTRNNLGESNLLNYYNPTSENKTLELITEGSAMDEKNNNLSIQFTTEIDTDFNKHPMLLHEDEVSTIKVIPVYDDDASIYTLSLSNINRISPLATSDIKLSESTVNSDNDIKNLPSNKVNQINETVNEENYNQSNFSLHSLVSIIPLKLNYTTKSSPTENTVLPNLHETFNNYMKEHYDSKLSSTANYNEEPHLTTFSIDLNQSSLNAKDNAPEHLIMQQKQQNSDPTAATLESITDSLSTAAYTSEFLSNSKTQQSQEYTTKSSILKETYSAEYTEDNIQASTIKSTSIIDKDHVETPIIYLDLTSSDVEKQSSSHQSDNSKINASSLTRIKIKNPVLDVEKIILEAHAQANNSPLTRYTLSNNYKKPNDIASGLIAGYPTYNQVEPTTEYVADTTLYDNASATGGLNTNKKSAYFTTNKHLESVSNEGKNVSYQVKSTTLMLENDRKSVDQTSAVPIYTPEGEETSTYNYEPLEVTNYESLTPSSSGSITTSSKTEIPSQIQQKYNPSLEKIYNLFDRVQIKPSKHHLVMDEYSNSITTSNILLDRYETKFEEISSTPTDEILTTIFNEMKKISTESQNGAYVVEQIRPLSEPYQNNSETTDQYLSTRKQNTDEASTNINLKNKPNSDDTTVLSIEKQPVTGKPYITSIYSTTKGFFEKIQSTIDKSAGRINVEEEKNKMQKVKPTESSKITMKNKTYYSTDKRPTNEGYQGYTRKTTRPINKATPLIKDHTTSKSVGATKETSTDKWTLIPQKNIVDQLAEVKQQPLKNSKEGSQQLNAQIVTLDHATGAIGLDQSNKGLDKDVSEFLNMCNELSFKFWTLANSELSSSRSITLSPFGMISTLAMIFLGARGLTSNQMNDILKLDDVVTFNPHLVFQNITDTVTLARGQGIQNAAFVRALFADRLKVRKIMPFYKEQAQQFYEGAVVDINFSTAGDILRRRTNLLIRKQTGGRIKDFVKTHTVPLRSPLTALSANVFQTSCDSPDASSEGRDGEMYFAVSQTVKQRKLVPIPAIVWKSGVSAGYEPSLDATAVALGDSKRPVSLIMVMPGQQGLTAAGDNLERLEHRLFGNPGDKTLEKLLKVIVPRRVEAQIPKFSHRSIVNITSALKKLGFDQLFTKTADLKGINGAGHDLYLADMLQMNLFYTCGDENKLGGRPLSETFPSTSSRHTRSLNADNNSKTKVDDFGYVGNESGESKISENSKQQENDCDDTLIVDDDLNGSGVLNVQLPVSGNRNARKMHIRQKLQENRLWWFTPAKRRRCRDRRQAEIEKPRMKMDKPFLYLIRHNLTGLILHIGRFNPKNQS